MAGKDTPASNPEWGPNRFLRDWSPIPVGGGLLYDPIDDDVIVDPDYRATSEGLVHKDRKDPYDLDPLTSFE